MPSDERGRISEVLFLRNFAMITYEEHLVQLTRDESLNFSYNRKHPPQIQRNIINIAQTSMWNMLHFMLQ